MVGFAGCAVNGIDRKTGISWKIQQTDINDISQFNRTITY